MSIRNIKWLLYKKKLKENFAKGWYKAMKPIALLIDKIEKKLKDRYYNKVRAMTIDEVVKRLSNVIIKELVRRSDLNWKYNLELEVAERTVYDEDNKTIIEYMQKQWKDKKLKSWAYEPKGALKMNKELAVLLKLALLDKGCIVETFEKGYGLYTYRKPKEYQYTLRIKLK